MTNRRRDQVGNRAATRGTARIVGVLAIVAALTALGPDAGARTLSLTTSSHGWAPASSATVHPGVQTFVDGAQCTANFVFTSGNDVLLGSAAHCSGTGEATDTDGCDAGVLPLPTTVQVSGASRPGTIVYNSWHTMQARGESDSETCAFNDFALIRLDPADHGRVNPSVPYWGGPVALGGATGTLDKVYSYGNSGLRLGISLLSPKEGYSLGTSPGGWSHSVYTLTPGVPGDSGSAFLDGSGRAIGVLSTLAIAPLPLSNGVSDLGRAIAYARTHGGLSDLTLVAGTQPFSRGLLP